MTLTLKAVPLFGAFVFICLNFPCYRPQRSCGKAIFSQASVILFTRVGVSARVCVAPSACWDTCPPRPPPAAAADGTHPTGMHSCFGKL